MAMEASKKPLHILSCFCRDSLKGYIYLEAERQAHVVEGLKHSICTSFFSDSLFFISLRFLNSH